MLAQTLIAAKRDGAALSAAQIQAFVDGLSGRDTGPAFSDAQVAAMAMAITLRGMDAQETALLTRAMTASGQVLHWRGPSPHGASGADLVALQAPASAPVLDKHSTGGVGDKVSLMLAPLMAACGAWVPMISGRGLAHTGGTLDKLEALPGFQVSLTPPALQQVMDASGCAIVSAGPQLAPADRRLYGIRDVTATVASLPLITASILSKKLAAGLEGLVMDVKTGRGAFMPRLEDARALADSLVSVAGAAGLPTVALITDMDQPLGWAAGHALEVHEALDFLCGRRQDARLRALTLALCAEALCLGGLAGCTDDALRVATAALDSGRAAEHFARMVAAQGGPADVLRDPALTAAPVVRVLTAPRDGWIAAVDSLRLGWCVVELGGGRRVPGEAIDHRVGLSDWPALGQPVRRGDPLLTVHAPDAARAEQALRQAADAFEWADAPPPGPAPDPMSIVQARVGPRAAP